MLKVSLALSVLASLTGAAHAADTLVLDCSPKAAVGFTAVQEKIYIKADGTVALYQTSRNGRVRSSVALAPGFMPAQQTEDGPEIQVPDGVFVGTKNDGDEMQITFNPKEMLIELSRHLDSEISTYACTVEKRLAIDFEAALEALANADKNGSTEY